MSPATSSPQRGVVLRDALAAAWLQERGLEVVGDRSLYLAANELRTSDFLFARIWHSPASIVTTTSGAQARLFVQVEGDSFIASETLEATLSAGGIAVLPTQLPFSITSTRNVGRYETLFDLGILSGHIAHHLERGIVYSQVRSAYRDILIGAGNTALNGTAAPSDKGYAGFRTAITSLAAAMLIEEVTSREPATVSRSDDLYFAARQVIVENATDPDFSVSQLARTLGITTRRLQMVFSDSGTTPKQALSEERIRLARVLMEREDRTRGLTREDIAARSGFRDRGALRRALATSGTRMREELEAH